MELTEQEGEVRKVMMITRNLKFALVVKILHARSNVVFKHRYTVPWYSLKFSNVSRCCFKISEEKKIVRDRHVTDPLVESSPGKGERRRDRVEREEEMAR